MSTATQSHHQILDAIWNRVVGGLEWLKEVIFGEFDENRELSAVIADMLASFVPGVIIVTSARDLTAVIIRLVKHPEKRAHVEEWMLVIACAIPLALPILAAAAGAIADGVGAIIGGIAGSEAGAVLRATCLLLIKQGAHTLAEIIRFLRRFIKGDTLVVLRDIKFVRYGKTLVQYVPDFMERIVVIIRKIRVELLKLPSVRWTANLLAKLEELERAFYDVQKSAVNAIPKALAELDARLQKVLKETLETGDHIAHPGVPAGHATPITPEPARVPAVPDNPLGNPPGTTPPPQVPPPVEEKPNLHPEQPKNPSRKTLAKLSSAGDKNATYELNNRKIADALANGHPEDAVGPRAENRVADSKGSDLQKAGEQVKTSRGPYEIDGETNTEVYEVKGGKNLPDDLQADKLTEVAQTRHKQPTVYYDPSKVSQSKLDGFAARHPDINLKEIP